MIHTSDWHLGRAFHQVGLLGAQAAYLDHLVEVCRSERVDAVLVSGDVYDRALPAPDTVALLSESVERIIDTGAQVVLSSGNHDSAIRLGFASGLLERAGLHIRTSLGSIGRSVLVDGVAVHPLPYLEPSLAADPLGATERTHAAVLRAAMERVRAERAAAPGRPTVVMAHAFVSGGTGSDSERDISAGGVAAVPPEVFDGRRLRRPRPPPRPPADHRHGRLLGLAGCDVLQRGDAPQGVLARRHRTGRAALPRARPGARRARPRRPARRPRLPSHRPHPHRRRVRLVPGDPHRPGPSGRGHGPGSGPFPVRPGAALRPGGRARAGPVVCRPGHRTRRRRRLLRLPRPRPGRTGGHRRGAGPARRGPRGVPGRPCRPRRRGRRPRRPEEPWRAPREAAPAGGHRLRALPGPGGGRLRRPHRHGPLPHPRADRRREDLAPRRRVLRPLCRPPRRPQQARPPVRPRGPRRRPRRRARAHGGRSAVPDPAQPRVRPPEEARERHRPGPGLGRARGARRRHLARSQHPPRRGRRRRQGRPRHGPRPVRQGGPPAPGRVRGLPPRLGRGAARRARAALRHRPVRRRRGVVGRAATASPAPPSRTPRAPSPPISPVSATSSPTSRRPRRRTGPRCPRRRSPTGSPRRRPLSRRPSPWR